MCDAIVVVALPTEEEDVPKGKELLSFGQGEEERVKELTSACASHRTTINAPPPALPLWQACPHAVL
jgi:hypothetical protein